MNRSFPSGVRRIPAVALLLSAALLLAAAAVGGTRPVTFRDLMAIRQIEHPVISDDGSWIAYGLRPDRGDGEVVARSLVTGLERRVARGAAPALSRDGAWLAAAVLPTQKERDEAKDGDERPEPGLAVLDTATGRLEIEERVASYAFSEDGRWLAWLHYEAEDSTDAAGSATGGTGPGGSGSGGSGGGASGATPEVEGIPGAAPADTAAAAAGDERLGALLVVRDLAGGRRHEIPYVTAYAFDDTSRHLAVAVAEPGGEENGLDLLMLLDDLPVLRVPLHRGYRAHCTHPVWASDRSRLAFLAATDDEDGEPGPAALWTWEEGWSEPRRAASAEDAPDGWTLPAKNDLKWSKDGERLFFGFRPAAADSGEGPGGAGDGDGSGQAADEAGEAAAPDTAEAPEPYDPYDLDALLADRELDVWHWNDPLIVPHRKKRWEKEKDRTYRAVHHRATGAVVPLADLELPDIRHTDNPRRALGLTDVPHRKEITWAGRFLDVFLVDLAGGERTPVTRHLPEDFTVSLSPEGRFLAWYDDRDWHLLDVEGGTTWNLTAALPVPFADEDHDYPSPPPGYGAAGWIEGDRAVLVHDKFDLWRFPTDGGEPVNLTAGEGRRDRRRFRVVDLDPDREAIRDDETLLLTSFHEPTKNGGLWRARADRPGVEPLVEEEKTYRFVAKAADSDRVLTTRESYTEFPDLWVSPSDYENPVRVSDANPDLDAFAWGTAELVEWTTADGTTLQGALIKPGNYEPGRRYPVMIYAYRLSSYRLHRFNEPVVNHRPSFPVYASHGYAVLLPDIRFTVGHPGRSAAEALTAAAEKLVSMGLADPDAIGLHGHSWGGYETAQVITETDVFAAAVAGAPVANMTSAYGGIRLESGLARQFQYETGQSRIGASLDEALPLYIENSPVFHARRITTPLLIQVGDADGAVPWQQGIELYLALRRLGKECHMLQYRGEPHHLKKYANKLDYSIKMKEFFDHHLKGAPAPAWMTEGVPYRGD